MTDIDLIIDTLLEYTTLTQTDAWGYDQRVCCGVTADKPHAEDCRPHQALLAAERIRTKLRYAEYWADDDDRSLSPAGIHGDDDNAGLAGEGRYLRR